MIREMLNKRRLPDLLNGARNAGEWRSRRRELLELLSREEYGFTPAAPETVRARVRSEEDTFGGKAVQSVVELSFDTPGGEFMFPVTMLVPKAPGPHPAFVQAAFRPDVPDKYLPAEEIIDHGFAVANFFYKDVTDDSAKEDGLAALYPRDETTGWGKIGMWAFAASRVMDYLETRPDIDASRVCMSGHSRLGKTALWCAAQDERFAMAVSNDSGCSGASLSRGKIGETIELITDPERFHYWFCGNYRGWAGREQEAPFDQHMLLALIAPRRLYVCSAEEDEWADPTGEFLGCAAADEAWRLLGCEGLTAPDALPQTDVPLHGGNIGYHVRTGGHFFSRTDWIWQMEYREKHGV